MDITFTDGCYKYSVDSIMMFQTDDQSDYWRDSLFEFHPSLNRKYFDDLNSDDKKQYLNNEIKKIYQENKLLISEKVLDYQQYWYENKEVIEQAFSEAFEVDAKKLFNDIIVNVTLNPICPRYLGEHIFDVFYLCSKKGALGISLHELVHFFWFDVWNKYFKDNYSEYESPSLKWILSEMVVRTIMHDKRLSSINPYYPNECIYEYFFDMKINDEPIVDVLDEMYKGKSITEFMDEAYNFCLLHEKGIRAYIK